MKLSEYILLSKEERTQHIDLDSPCIPGSRKQIPKATILGHLGIDEDDFNDWKKEGVQRCHLCSNNSKVDAVCRNPLHIYLGTQSENEADKSPEQKAAKKVQAGLNLGGAVRGKHTFRDPTTNELIFTTREDAALRGLVGMHKDQKRPTVPCLHCGRDFSDTNIGAHIKACVEREGSWNWFVRELKRWDKQSGAQRQRVLKSAYGGNEGRARGRNELKKKVWMSVQTGHISNSAGLTLYLNHRGLDKKKRIRLQDAELTPLLSLSPLQRMMAVEMGYEH